MRATGFWRGVAVIHPIDRHLMPQLHMPAAEAFLHVERIPFGVPIGMVGKAIGDGRRSEREHHSRFAETEAAGPFVVASAH